MTSTLVIYTTKYGTTETYAKQIATALKADLKEIANVEAHDLIFYDTPSHVAIYIGNGRVVHASNERVGIITSNMYYRTPVKIVNMLGD